ncbi:hypothetical protein COCNU_07G012010 [Cocos nucifera]|uniref:Uncharacterized protein n=1 Tax=Cocos nucifera TaxID=13894 RepID=A0A8K0IGB6_COCNU|nr:hypothetical protein COCNU_07G012010 [Cocos nucifera]
MAFNDLGHLLDANVDGAMKGLDEGFGLGHHEEEGFRPKTVVKRGFLADGLGEAHGDDSLASANLDDRENGIASALAIMDDLEAKAGSLMGGLLADYALRDGTGLWA